ncbi:uncharacterized protein K441DRAFT_682389 [Cenococcum geophilum 1.58]|uniref:Uncharacterized protein n=1 Tax=Cenococcum geophilum 1.58 TaxID=794803 RepID=A0ACC8ENB7_9PEZI|nr:hypothetical protein K441DRAFT_682389 [Cenococcum geophilum 1.58]
MSNHPRRNWETQGPNDYHYAHENTNPYVPTRAAHNRILAQTTPGHSQGLNDHRYSHENTNSYENSVLTRASHNQILHSYPHENTNSYENSIPTPAPHNQVLAQTPSHLPQGQSHITQEYSSHQPEPQAPQVSPPATGVWPTRHTYNESPHRENAYNFLGRNSGSRNTLPTPNFTVNPSNPRDLDGNSIDSHNQSVSLDDQSADYGGPSAALPGQSRDIDSQTPSSPANMNQLTHGHAPQQTNIFQPADLRAEGSLYGNQSGFSLYPTAYNNEGQDWDQSESLVGLETPSSAASPGDEKSASMSRSSSRSKQKNSFACDNEDCTASFTRLADLQRHQSTVHTKEKLFPCSVNNCSRVKDRGFSRRDHLTEHLRSYHAMPIPKRKPGQRAAPNSGMMG